MRNFTALLVAGVFVLAGSAHAENYVLYDSFGTALNPTKYTALERTRVISNGTLLVAQRDLGNQVNDTGHSFLTWGTNVRGGGQNITQMQVTMKTTLAHVTDCPANPSASFVQQRMLGSFFSAGGGQPGSHVNDVLAIARLGRFAADPQGQLRLEALIVQCTSSDCNQSTALFVQQIGTVNIGALATVRMDWDKANKRFIFRHAGATHLAPYQVSDAQPPSMPFKQLGTRTSLESCFSGERTEGHIRGVFENFLVNASAAPAQ